MQQEQIALVNQSADGASILKISDAQESYGRPNFSRP